MTPIDKYLVFALLLLFLTSCGKESTNEVENLSLAFEEELALGTDQNVPREELLISPNQVHADAKGNIYVADSKLSAIKVFDAAGKYLRTIGQKGKGPGEFLYNATFHINSNQLLALDTGNRRIMRFTTEGEVVETLIPDSDTMIWSNRFKKLGDDHYMMIKKERTIGNNKGAEYRSMMMHEFDADFENRLASFGHIDSLLDANSNFVQVYISSINAGSFYPVTKDELWFAPGIYRGEIFVFKKNDREWNRTETIMGKLTPKQAVEVGADGKRKMVISVYTNEGRLAVEGQVNSKSRNLFKLKDGRMMHVSSQLINDTTRTVAEIFNTNGELTATGVIHELSYPDNDYESYANYLWEDENDRFYFIDQTEDIPLVKVGRIKGLNIQ